MKALSVILTVIVPTLAHGQPQCRAPCMNSTGVLLIMPLVLIHAAMRRWVSRMRNQLITSSYCLGEIFEVSTNDKTDMATLDEIRGHLSHIAQMFREGDFHLPMFIHDTVPPGVPVMRSKGTAITYTFESTSTGGRVRITTSDQDALKAVHQFLTFQIDDHRTGDPHMVKPPA